jgi:hypothetical protein
MTTSLYRTRHLYFAAYLKTAGVPFLHVEMGSTGWAVFCFEPVPQMRDLIDQYNNRTAQVVALDFVESLQALRAVITRERSFLQLQDGGAE